MDVLVEEFEFASEAFATGTAAELVSIREFGEYLVEGDDPLFNPDIGRDASDLLQYKMGADPGPVMSKVLTILREIMFEVREDKFGWLRDPFASVEEFRR